MLSGMTAEEFLDSRKIEDYHGGHLSYTVSLEDAKKALKMIVDECHDKPNGGLSGWMCPKCGRVFSPFTSMCGYCGNNNLNRNIIT